MSKGTAPRSGGGAIESKKYAIFCFRPLDGRPRGITFSSEIESGTEKSNGWRSRPLTFFVNAACGQTDPL
jgi:hypothetical protein